MANSKYDELYFTEQELKNAEAIREAARNGQTDWQSAHDYVEGIRSNYGYSGGKQGDQYIATGKPAAAQAYMPSVGEAPTFSSKYSGQMDDVLGKIQNRDPFSYDYTTDPQWQSYKKEYTREGQRAAADTMGQYAAMTGGMPSTAAVTASQQAGDYYMAQMTDKIPELYQAAYRMYQDQGADLYNQLNALNGMYQNDYNKYLSDLDQYNRDRDFDYNQYIDNRNYNYQLGRDSVTDSQWEKEFGLNKDNAAYNRAVSDATNFGNWDGFKALGYSDSQVALMKAAYQQQIAQQTASKSSGGSGGSRSGGSGSGSGSMDYDSLFRDAMASGNPKSFIANKYKEYGFKSSSGLSADYDEWAKKDSNKYGGDYVFNYVKQMYNAKGGLPSAMQADLKKMSMTGQISDAQLNKIVDWLEEQENKKN